MIFERVKERISETLDIDIDEIQLKDNLREDYDLDSLDLVDLVMNLEDEFDLEVDDEDFEEIDTIESVVDYIEEKLEERG